MQSNNESKITEKLIKDVDNLELFKPPTLDEQVKVGKIAEIKENNDGEGKL